MRNFLLLSMAFLALAGCKKKPEGPDEFTKAYLAAGDLGAEDPELGADSLYSLYKNNPKYPDEERLRECLFLSANWVYGKISQVSEKDTAEQTRLMRKAAARYQEFVEKYPTSPKAGQAYKDLAYCLFILKDYRGCINVCNTWINDPLASASPYLPYAYKYAGRAYTYLNKKDSAIIYLKEAYKLFDAQAFLGEAKAMEEDLNKLGVKKPYYK
ncbi:MAG: hypothetical protein ABIM88_06910 [candidate division WOR-3 bacterium]